MIAVEAIGIVVLAALAIATTWMAVTGLLGAIGVIRLRRCRVCGHLLPSGPLRSFGACPYCRHPWFVRHFMPVHIRHLFPREMAPPERPR